MFDRREKARGGGMKERELRRSRRADVSITVWDRGRVARSWGSIVGVCRLFVDLRSGLWIRLEGTW